MDWSSDEAPDGCNGFVVAVVLDEEVAGRYRELRFPEDDAVELGIDYVQVGCTCGWRSPRYIAPAGTRYAPFRVVLPDFAAEHEAYALWRRHLDHAVDSQGRVLGQDLPRLGSVGEDDEPTIAGRRRR